MPADLVAWLMLPEPAAAVVDLGGTWSQLRDLVAIRRAYGRPMSARAYSTIWLALVAHDAGGVSA